jgi:hypothetical protein
MEIFHSYVSLPEGIVHQYPSKAPFRRFLSTDTKRTALRGSHDSAASVESLPPFFGHVWKAGFDTRLPAKWIYMVDVAYHGVHLLGHD